MSRPVRLSGNMLLVHFVGSLILVFGLLSSVLAASVVHRDAGNLTTTATETATKDVLPRATESGISPIECTLQLSIVQCCQEFELVRAITASCSTEFVISDIYVVLGRCGVVDAYTRGAGYTAPWIRHDRGV